MTLMIVTSGFLAVWECQHGEVRAKDDFECDKCDKKYSRKGHLNRHIKSAHQNLFLIFCLFLPLHITEIFSMKIYVYNCICFVLNLLFMVYKGCFCDILSHDRYSRFLGNLFMILAILKTFCGFGALLMQLGKC